MILYQKKNLPFCSYDTKPRKHKSVIPAFTMNNRVSTENAEVLNVWDKVLSAERMPRTNVLGVLEHWHPVSWESLGCVLIVLAMFSAYSLSDSYVLSIHKSCQTMHQCYTVRLDCYRSEIIKDSYSAA